MVARWERVGGQGKKVRDGDVPIASYEKLPRAGGQTPQ